MTQSIRQILAASVLVALARLCAAADGGPLVMSISVEPITKESQSVVLRASLLNKGGSTVSVLKWGTPLEGLRDRVLRVIKGGEEVPYEGVLAKRSAPEPSDWVTLRPGESSAPILTDLSQSYSLVDGASYTIAYIGAKKLAVRSGPTPAKRSRAATETVSVSFEITGAFSIPAGARIRSIQKSNDTSRGSHAAGITFDGCDATQQGSLTSNHADAEKLALNGVTYESGHSSTDAGDLYTTWFGSATDTRYSRVQTCIGATDKALKKNSHKYFCEDASGDCAKYYAWVKAGSPYEVHVCPKYWTLPDPEYGTQAGAIVHETTHFNNVCSTGDNSEKTYGRSLSKKLATSDPDTATNTADNYEYFSEDAPASSKTDTRPR